MKTFVHQLETVFVSATLLNSVDPGPEALG
jgi:hypothetical protein